MTEGPFYPPRRWRDSGARHRDWDADLTAVRQGSQVFRAEGEHLALVARVVDTRGQALDRCEVEIWQCDARAVYHHPNVDLSKADPGFQGFGAAVSDAAGEVRLRTIRPVPYPGRTPHIHVRLRHVTTGEWTSQLFLAGDPGNARDFLWRGLSAPLQQAASLRLEPASGEAAQVQGLRWTARVNLVVPA
jgi:protocatechuate 3,4-dioxygenase beta subunit